MAKAKAQGTGVSRLQIALLVLAVVFILGAIAAFLQVQRDQQRAAALDNVALDVRTFYSSVIQVARESSQGLEPNRAFLFALIDDFDDVVWTLREGDERRNIPPMTAEYGNDIEALETAWLDLEPVIDDITAGLPAAQRSKTDAATMDTVISGLRTQSDALLQGTTGAARATAALQRAQLEELRTAADTMIRLEARPDAEAGRLQELFDTVVATSTQMGEQAPAAVADAAAAINAGLEQIGSNVEGLVAAAPALSAFNDATGGFLGRATPIETAGGALENRMLLEAREIRPSPLPGIILGVLAIVALALFIVVFTAQLRRQANEAMRRDREQQEAILLLLDEITNLADGDLTVGVTVTEDFTGAIADSLNLTVENMRGLVGQINAASAEIAAAAEQTQSSAGAMSRQSEEQAQQTVEAANTISQNSRQLQDVAGRAREAAQQAQQSVQVAHNGAETVERTIGGMNALRDQIQDTSKRIKRLGESSQEIGNITEIINDIAEQTNTLALNASIQAAMAGEAGRGFAVVADEVQRLAERAGNATRQIENLVKTIQADTSEAISSMERSTANVVSGASTAEEAGQALMQIENASTNLAATIDEIAGRVREQSAEGESLAQIMQQIREVAVSTAQASRKTAADVGRLTALSTRLRDSVSGFNLPAAGGDTPQVTLREDSLPGEDEDEDRYPEALGAQQGS